MNSSVNLPLPLPRHVAVIGAAGGLGQGILSVCREEEHRIHGKGSIDAPICGRRSCYGQKNISCAMIYYQLIARSRFLCAG